MAAALLVLMVVLVVLAARRERALQAMLDGSARALSGDQLVDAPGLGAAADRLDRLVARHVHEAERVASEEQRVVAALDVLQQGVVVANEAGRTLYRNPVAEGFRQGRHGAALVGATVDDLVAQAARGVTVDREVELFGPPSRVLYVSAQPVLAGGRRVGVLALIDDITEHQRIDAIRRDFVANISHELRTPIGALSLLAETLQGEDDPVTITALAARIQAEAERMGRTVEDLLELSRIEHGDVLEDEVDVRDAVRTAVSRAAVAAEQKQVSLGAQLPDRPLLVAGDLRQLSSAVFNLIDNAVKYTPTGGTVGLRAVAADDLIEVSVHDTGVGIPRRDLDRIFERFYRVDRARSRDSGGTGLGLSIVRHVAANHGGRVTVDSTEGEGSTFTLVLPRADAADDDEHAIPDRSDSSGGW
ncbi:MAG: hypothetical protein KDB21_08080 [Acidimicrobiales bacterium]|nr:hypothetical protein [Acidimicrobiales bacterium]